MKLRTRGTVVRLMVDTPGDLVFLTYDTLLRTMPYFHDHYLSLQFPRENAGNPGFRDPQRGALFALGSHFTRYDDPAVVAMPTGSGKTAVLMAVPFLLQARRVLVITPSRLVRGQIARRFATLHILREIGAIGDGVPDPTCFEVINRLQTDEAWEELRQQDVVIATPASVSPGHVEVVPPPEDLFDLLLVDEAHHSPARTWNHLLEAFPAARRALFTATPFRSDRREIKGRFVYTYSTKQAFSDGVFGQVVYHAVRSGDGEAPDVAVARDAETVLAADREAGLAHRLIVRTDTKVRAEALRRVYEDATNLRLQLIHSGHSSRHVRSVIRKLEAGDLDGLICVDMLGEGFDFPHLKVAAIHAPHKSLAVTLQFIGRFARTNAPDIGRATFLAVPDDIMIEARRLYEEGAVWEDIVLELGDDRIDHEIDVREQLETFQVVHQDAEEVSDLSLYSLTPAQHVKIYRTRGEVDISETWHRLGTLAVIHHDVSDELSAAVLVTREVKQPRWSDATQFARIEYDLFVIVYCAEESLLFVCASRRSVATYEEIADRYTGGAHNILPLRDLNRVLRSYRDLTFWNVGMRSRFKTRRTESYRIVAGSGVDDTITPTDGRLFHRGHCFGGSRTESGRTIGLSSSSKVWSMGTLQIPQLVEWCQNLAKEIVATESVLTGSGLDLLQMDREVSDLPSAVIGVEWGPATFTFGEFSVRIAGSDWCPLAHTSLELLSLGKTEGPLRVQLFAAGVSTLITYDLATPELWGVEGEAEVSDGSETMSLLAFVKEHPLQLLLSDFSSVAGRLHLPTHEQELFVPEEVWHTEDWADNGVDIQLEVGKGPEGSISIQDRVRAALLESEEQCVVLDHGTGEIADLVTLSDEDGVINAALYHCKASSGRNPGSRVADIYEVAGQVARSARWVGDYQYLVSEILRRVANIDSSIVVKGEEFLEGLRRGPERGMRLEVVLVQPGISRQGLEQNVGDVLAAAVDFAIQSGIDETRVWCST